MLLRLGTVGTRETASRGWSSRANADTRGLTWVELVPVRHEARIF